MKQLLIAALLAAATALPGADLIRVSTEDALKAAVNKPQPVYSPVARQMKVAGKVEVEAVVLPDGSVDTAKPVSGNPLLTASAVAAVSKWKFNPFTADGQPTKALVRLSFDFRP